MHESETQGEVPFELRSLNAEQVADLLGLSRSYVRDNLSARPDFPKRADSDGHPRWIARDILEWRANLQAERSSGRRRRRGPRLLRK